MQTKNKLMKTKTNHRIFLLTTTAFILALALVPTASAADGTWTGGSSVTWATPGNWSGSVVPGGTAANSDLATFNSGTYSFAPTAANSYFIGGLVFGSANGGITMTTGTTNSRLNVGSSGIQMNSGTGAVILGNASTQGINITANQTWSNDSSSLLNIGRVSVDDTFSGTYTITIAGSGSGGVTVNNNLSDDNNAASALRRAAVVINSSGTGATSFANGSTYSGGTTLTAGLLQISGTSSGTVGAVTSSSVGTGNLALNGGRISSGSTGNRSILNALSIGGDVAIGDAVNNGTLTFSANTDLGGATRMLNLVSNATFDGVVSNGGITKQGASMLTFLGASANTYTGLTTVSAGGLTLNKTAVDAIAGNVLVNGTGTLTLGAANQINNASDVEVAAGTFALGAFSDTVNNLKLTGGAITGSGTLTSTTAFDFQNSGNIAAVLAGTAGANKTTAGTVTFTGGNANTYTGLTTVSAGILVLGKTANVVALAGDALVNGGTLQIVNANQIQDSANVEVATGGTFAMGGNTDTVNGVKLTGGAITGTGVNGILTSITAYDLQSGSSSAVLAGAAGATKTTAGTVALNRANTYSGGTTLSAGTLQLGVASVGSVGAITSSAIGTGILGLNGGTLSSDSNANRTILNATTIGGNVTLGDAAANGTLTFSAGVDLGGIARTLTTASAATFNGVVSNGSINKAGAGTLTLGGNSTYTGGTTVEGGTLLVSTGGSIAQSSLTTVTTGTTLTANGTVGAVVVNTGGTLNGAGTIGTATVAGTLNPGNSPGVLNVNGNLTMASGGNMIWELFANTATQISPAVFDQVVVSGDLDFAGTNGITLNFGTTVDGSTVSWSDSFWNSNQSFLIYDVAGSTTGLSNLSLLNTSFNDATGAALAASQGSFSVSQLGSDVFLSYNAIPEPSTGTLLAFGTGGLLLTRLLRRKQS